MNSLWNNVSLLLNSFALKMLLCQDSFHIEEFLIYLSKIEIDLIKSEICINYIAIAAIFLLSNIFLLFF